MTEHFTKGTEGAPHWCGKCGRFTIHKVSGHRLGRCTEHESQPLTKAQAKRKEMLERLSKNPNLFGGE
jgi:hypothetical protein